MLIQHEASPYQQCGKKEIRLIQHDLLTDGILHSLISLSGIMKEVVELSFPARNKRKLKNNPSLINVVKDKYTSYRIKGTTITFHFTASVIFVDYDGTIYACSHDHLLCYASKVDTHVSYRLLMQWAKRTYLSVRDINAMNNIIELLHVTHIQVDQNFFACAKVLDGLCQAHLLLHPDVDGAKNDLMLRQIKHECSHDPILTVFETEMSEILRSMSASALVEASCFGKISGHPSVDVEAGLAQLHERTTNQRHIDPHLVRLSVIALKKQYVINFIVKHKKWPPLTPRATNNILSLVRVDALPDGPEASRLNIHLTDADWNSINFEPTRRLQLITSLLPFIKDRTISLTRDELFSTYAHEKLHAVYKQIEPLTPREAYERSALVLYVLLTRNLLDEFREFLDKVVHSSLDDYYDVLAYLVIKVVPKEGELKSKARLFGEKPFSYRLYSMLQEQTAVSFMNDYFPQDQAMTCGDLELKRRLYTITTMPVISPDHTYVHLVIDISGWNNGFRQATVGPIGKVLDQIHGTALFERTQTLYENSTILNKEKNELRGWVGQLGGIEGLNQDTWVITYVSNACSLSTETI